MVETMAKDKKTRASRVDSKEKAVETFKNANKIIEPPSDIAFTNQQHMAFSEVIDEFANVDWSRHSIRLAAALARALIEYQSLQDDLINEGYTVPSGRNGDGVSMNPKMSACNMLASQIMNLRRTLALHALAGKNGVDVGKQRRIRKGQQDDAPDNSDNLINT
jgi:hypothetical protein